MSIKLNVMVVCECSGVVRDAFIKAGHNAISVDLKAGGGMYKDHHIQSDFFEAVNDGRIDLNLVDIFIAHPPCTRLCNSGVLRLYKDGKKKNGIDPAKWQEMLDGAKFYADLMKVSAHIKYRCFENPIMHGHAKKAIGLTALKINPQYIQPYNFGENASKTTGLLLFNLPRLKETKFFAPRIVKYNNARYFRWGNQTDSGQNKLPPSASRAADRAVTYAGIAAAMADQWGNLNN